MYPTVRQFTRSFECMTGAPRHQVHRRAHHIVVVPDAYHVGIGHVGPQHGIGEGPVTIVARDCARTPHTIQSAHAAHTINLVIRIILSSIFYSAVKTYLFPARVLMSYSYTLRTDGCFGVPQLLRHQRLCYACRLQKFVWAFTLGLYEAAAVQRHIRTQSQHPARTRHHLCTRQLAAAPLHIHDEAAARYKPADTAVTPKHLAAQAADAPRRRGSATASRPRPP